MPQRTEIKKYKPESPNETKLAYIHTYIHTYIPGLPVVSHQERESEGNKERERERERGRSCIFPSSY